jgi:DNA-binding beta-propeller fold protein YncE
VAEERVAVLSATGFVPRLVRTVPVPQQAVGNSLTPDGRYLLIADGGDGATVVSVHRLEAGDPRPVLGTLTSPSGSAGGAIEVIGSPDGRYAFVSLEGLGELAVYNLQAALHDGFRKSAYIGAVPLEVAPVGMALSPNGRWLYATSEAGGSGGEGTLSVINIDKAERDPAHAVVATIAAHCSPVRVVAAAGGRTVWVTARESDQLLAFSALRLRTDPRHALIAAVRVGEAPVGLALVNGGRDVVVADSNRFAAPGARAELTVVSAAAALAHRRAILGTIRAGAFPREIVLEPSGKTLLVGNFGSDQLQAVSLASHAGRKSPGGAS